MVTEYHKISGPFKRDPADLKKVIWDEWVDPTVAMLADAPIWYWTEKVDGTNVRVIWDGHRISYAGRTDRAELHPQLVERLDAIFRHPVSRNGSRRTFPARPTSTTPPP